MRPSSQNANTPFRKNPRFPAGGFVKVEANAKINLFLDVVGKRADGYHNIVSVMQSISLQDELEIFLQDSKVELICNNPALPTDKTNLIVKAANALIKEYSLSIGFKIFLNKKIAVGAGLAGGSSNCAATLHGINKLCNLNIPLEKLCDIGKTLGADVPFCLTGGTALTEGIGEKITPLISPPKCFIVIVCPNIFVSTRDIFAKIKTFSNANVNEMLNAISKKDLQQITASFYNIFTPITASIHPVIYDIISQLKLNGALNAEMSGTGSSVFAYFGNENCALNALNIMKEKYKTFLCSTL